LDDLPGCADRVLIAANPRAGARSSTELVNRLADILLEKQLGVEIITDLDKLAASAREFHAAGRLRAIVAAGGDGTVAEIVNRTAPDMPVAVFPLGTANLLATYLGIRADADQFAQTILRGAVVRLDAARAGTRVFLLMAGIGFDAEVVNRLHSQRSGHIRYWSYAKPIFDSIRSYEYPELRVYCESGDNGGEEQCVRARWAFVVNLPCYAGGLSFAPQAIGTDGLLDLCTFSRGRLRSGLRYLGHVVFRLQQRLPDCKMSLSGRVRIESDLQVPYQLDGDPGGFLPLEIEVLPRRVTLVVPAATKALLERSAALVQKN